MNEKKNWYIPAGSTIFVTGATGYIGAHVVNQLLLDGYKVIASSTSQQKVDNLLKTLNDKQKSNLETVIITDLTNRSKVNEVADKVDAIIHVAFSNGMSAPTPQETEAIMVKPTIEQTLCILETAASHPRIKRVVVTSSIATVMDFSKLPGPPGHVYTESDWSPLPYEAALNSDNRFDIYTVAKKYAELKAWDFMKENKDTITFDIVQLQPTRVIGPTQHHVGSSMELSGWLAGFVYPLITCQLNQVPKARIRGMCDVRDVAVAHVRALQVTNASGERFIINNADHGWHEFLEAVKDIPGINAPSHDPNDNIHACLYDSSKSKQILGIEYRSPTETYRDMAMQLVDLYQRQSKTNM